MVTSKGIKFLGLIGSVMTGGALAFSGHIMEGVGIVTAALSSATPLSKPEPAIVIPKTRVSKR